MGKDPVNNSTDNNSQDRDLDLVSNPDMVNDPVLVNNLVSANNLVTANDLVSASSLTDIHRKAVKVVAHKVKVPHRALQALVALLGVVVVPLQCADHSV
jgi:hypothetical protein